MDNGLDVFVCLSTNTNEMQSDCV